MKLTKKNNIAEDWRRQIKKEHFHVNDTRFKIEIRNQGRKMNLHKNDLTNIGTMDIPQLQDKSEFINHTKGAE